MSNPVKSAAAGGIARVLMCKYISTLADNRITL